VEGYVESAATGMLAGLNAALWLAGDPPSIPPDTTAVGSLIRYLTDPNHGPGFQPMNINFGLFPPLPEVAKEKELRKRKFVDRALEDLQRWISRSSLLKTI
jgi:methylenetetrahydrofolate--tRNA-(uracil-5-)-methyltransferase